jgi:hypothetical protein
VRKLWARLKHNWPAKALSLLAAFLLWFQLKSSEPIVERVLKRPLEVIGLGPDRVAVGLPKTVVVRVRGEARRVENLRPEAVVAYLDLSGVEEGPFDRAVEVQLPAGLEAVAVIPARVIGAVDHYLERRLPLYAFAPKKALVPRPEAVTVVGPASAMENAGFALALGPGLGVRVFDAEGRPIEAATANPEAAELRFSGPLLSEKAVPLALPGPPPGLSVVRVEAPRTVTLIGPPEALAALDFVAGEVEWRPGSYTAPIRLRLPEGVRVLGPVWGRFVVEKVE